MGKLNKNIIFYLLIMLVLYQFHSCQKEPFNLDQKFFIKTFHADSVHSDYGLFIEELRNEDLMIISIANNCPLITRTDMYGNFISQRAVPDNSFNFPSYLCNFSTIGDPWHFLGQAGRTLIRFDTSGKITDKTQVPFGGVSSIYRNNYYYGAVQNGSGFLVPFSDGVGLTISTTNKIYEYDGNLNLIKSDSISDKRLGGHTQDIYLCPGTQSEPYTIFGQKLPRTYWNGYDNVKLYAARVPATGKVTETLIDTGDLLTKDMYEWQTRSLDSDDVILGQRYNMVNTHIYYPIVIKFDKNLNIVWKQTYDVDYGAFSVYNIITCRDGGFLIVGSIGQAGYPDEKPCALKIDANGNKQWEKSITSASGTGEFWYGIQLLDGGYAFVGDTKQFGKGKNSNQLIFVRTDANGNY